MLNFLHNIGAGIVSIFVAVTGIFQTQLEAIVLSPRVQIMSTTTVEVASSTIKSDKVQSTIIVNKSVNNSTQTQNEIKKQLEASPVVKVSNDALTARQKAEEDVRSKALSVAEENQKNTDLLKQLAELKTAVAEQSSALNKIVNNAPPTASIHSVIVDSKDTVKPTYTATFEPLSQNEFCYYTYVNPNSGEKTFSSDPSIKIDGGGSSDFSARLGYLKTDVPPNTVVKITFTINSDNPNAMVNGAQNFQNIADGIEKFSEGTFSSDGSGYKIVQIKSPQTVSLTIKSVVVIGGNAVSGFPITMGPITVTECK